MRFCSVPFLFPYIKRNGSKNGENGSKNGENGIQNGGNGNQHGGK